MDQYRSETETFEELQDHWSTPISGEIHMDQSLVHNFSWGNSYGPMVPVRSCFAAPSGRNLQGHFWGTRIEHKPFFLKLFGHPSRQNPGMSRQKVGFPWVSKDMPNFLAPTPSREKPPPHPKISGPESLDLGSFKNSLNFESILVDVSLILFEA